MTREEANKFLANILPLLSARMQLAIKTLEQEPAARNCYGCKYSKDNHNSGTEECHLCMWENQYTPQEPKSEWQQDHAILKAYSDGANEVLDKIRFDLYKLYNDRPSDYNHSQRTELFCEVIKILDKYKAESEE